MDLTPGQAITAEITIVNVTMDGETVYLPQHIDHPNSLQEVTVDGDTSFRFAIPHALCTLYGEDSTWGNSHTFPRFSGFFSAGLDSGWLSEESHRMKMTMNLKRMTTGKTMMNSTISMTYEAA